MTSYYEKLKDVRWQKKRLEVLNERQWTCQHCGIGGGELHGKQLQVHHGYYEKNLDPWEYDNTTLWVLCNECHENIEVLLLEIRRKLGAVRPEKILDVYEALQKIDEPRHEHTERWALRLVMDTLSYVHENGLQATVDVVEKRARCSEERGCYLPMRSIKTMFEVKKDATIG